MQADRDGCNYLGSSCSRLGIGGAVDVKRDNDTIMPTPKPIGWRQTDFSYADIARAAYPPRAGAVSAARSARTSRIAPR
eukprot:1740805-Pyramimonas_sp.AAC.1